jgi:hypothetical protein
MELAKKVRKDTPTLEVLVLKLDAGKEKKTRGM